MHLNYYFLKQLIDELKPIITGSQLIECYSQNKGEVIFGLSNGQSEFFIKAIFHGNFSMVNFPGSLKRAKKNSIDLFQEILMLKVINVRVSENERSFFVKFENTFTLVFKLHGNRSNILLFKKENLSALFRNNLTSDQKIDFHGFDRPIDQSDDALYANNFNLKQTFPTFDKHIYHHLNEQNFDQIDSQVRKLLVLKKMIKELNDRHFYIYSSNQLPYLSLFEEKNKQLLFKTSEAIAAINYLSSSFLPTYHLIKEKSNAINQLSNKLKKCLAYIEKSNQSLQNIKSSIKYEEVANILMANLHTIHDNTSSIELNDFYRNKQITIKLKKNLSLQKNAEIYYRKHKNQQIEIDTLTKNISTKESEKESLETELKNLQQINNLNELRKYNRTNSHSITRSPKPTTQPFYSLEVQGFKVLIGKNAKGNDQLIAKFASKNDMWLHARGVSGSHVIIKEKPNSKYPEPLIEKVAELAAWYSKGKNDTLCPVIYTLRKFVRKPKGGLPGQVIVEKEEVILVKPCRNAQ